jgi:hypothetical protein
MGAELKILDTNVLIHANGDQSPQTSAECKEKCLKLLVSGMAQKYQIVIDGGKNPDASEMLAEYRHKLHEAGGGYGEMFLRWLLIHWQQLVLIPITKRDDTYEEFPDDKRLNHFDPADRKWIATAISCQQYGEGQPDIVQSADYKWKPFVPILAEYDMQIDFICAEP